jgi:pyruvate/2-oxoglutarate dehydrogenase complex dihydrolipoamide acyltransferase (E2) component
MATARGTTRRPSIGRKLVAELMRHAKDIPSLPLARDCRIPELNAARKAVVPSPSWTALFLKAYAIVAKDHPELRQAWLTFPYVRIYEHPTSECAILIERELDGEPIVLATKIHTPDAQSLPDIDRHLKGFRDRPLREVSAFRQLLRIGKMPSLVRRFLFWSSLQWSGYKRAKRFGTFMASSLGNLGVEQMHPLSPLTTYFTFGPVSPEGVVTLKIIYDHRVMDGRHVARALVDLERVMNGEILQELKGLRSAA